MIKQQKYVGGKKYKKPELEAFYSDLIMKKKEDLKATIQNYGL